MFIFKRRPALTEQDLGELKGFVSKTVEVMLLTKEETIHTLEKYDLAVSFSWEGEYIEGSVFQLSTFHISTTGMSTLSNVPLYTVTRHFSKKEPLSSYIDDERIKNLSKKNLLALYGVCELASIFEVEITQSNRYACIW